MGPQNPILIIKAPIVALGSHITLNPETLDLDLFSALQALKL